jgi:phosphatidylethanolamine-binding protein (PEBP) family uncharacterized protein
VWNIPGTATGMPENVRRVRAEGRQPPDQRQRCGLPWSGRAATGPLHHYTFELYALDTKVDLPAGADAWETRTAVWKAMEGHVLGKAVYVGLFRRPAVDVRSMQ